MHRLVIRPRVVRLVGVSVLALLVLFGATRLHTARAADTATPVNVNAFACIRGFGGHRTVPAGSTVVIRLGWTSLTRGAVGSFLEAQTSLLSVNDAEMIDVSATYDEPQPGGLGGWISFVHYPTGVTLANAGDSMRFTFALLLDRPVTDVFDFDEDGTPDPRSAPAGLQFGGTCTVTAA